MDTETQNLNAGEGLSRVDKKLLAAGMLRTGLAISEIARQLEVSRGTVYRWNARTEAALDAPQKRRPRANFHEIRNILIEAFVVLGAPSIPKFVEALDAFYGLKISSSRLRRYLKKIGLHDFSPTATFVSLLRSQAQRQFQSRRRRRYEKVVDTAL